MNMRTHPDPAIEAVIETLRWQGPLSARAVLRLHPDLQDTVGSTRTLKGLVDQGYLQTFQEEGRNATFGILIAPPAGAAREVRPAPNATQSDTAIQSDLDVILGAAVALGELSISEAIALFPTSRNMTRPLAKQRLKVLVDDGRLEMTGRTRNAKYRAVGVAAQSPTQPAPANEAASPLVGFALPCARALLEAVQAERRMYAELLGAAMGSSDLVVRRLACAAQGVGGVVNGLVN